MSGGDLLFQMCYAYRNCGPTVVGRLVISRNAHIFENIYFMVCHETGTICYGLMVIQKENVQRSNCCYSYKCFSFFAFFMYI